MQLRQLRLGLLQIQGEFFRLIRLPLGLVQLGPDRFRGTLRVLETRLQG